MTRSKLTSRAARLPLAQVRQAIAAARVRIASDTLAAHEELLVRDENITGGSTTTIADLETQVGPPVVVAHNATYSETATSGELIILASGTFTINLPTAVGNQAKITVKLLTASTVTLDPAGSQTIDGGATAVLNVQYAALSIVSDGANWVII